MDEARVVDVQTTEISFNEDYSRTYHPIGYILLSN
jgi:hypothetical protein